MLVQAVLTVVPIYMLLAMDIPKWAIKAIEKIIRAFLWRGAKELRGGHCPVSWERVARPHRLGGLDILHLEKLGWALVMAPENRAHKIVGCLRHPGPKQHEGNVCASCYN